jgi:hypothetical protein
MITAFELGIFNNPSGFSTGTLVDVEVGGICLKVLIE